MNREKLIQLLPTNGTSGVRLFGEEQVKELRKEAERLDSLNTPEEILSFDNGFPQNQLTDFGYFKASLERLELNIEVLNTVYNDFTSKLERLNIPAEIISDLKFQLIPGQQVVANSINEMAYSLGMHNQSILLEKYIATGKESHEINSQKADRKYFEDHRDAFFLLKNILLDFYSKESNQNFRLNTVLNTIQDICVEYRIKFPLDRKVPGFKKRINLLELPQEVFKAGAPKSEFRTIELDTFHSNYENIFKKYSSS